MSPHDPNRTGESADPPRDAHLDAAIDAVRSHTDARWVQIADRARRRALSSTRRSAPVNARASSGPVRVSEQVLITYLRDSLATVQGARVEDIVIAVGADNSYTGVTVFISARYRAPLLPVADAMRDLASARLRELLGDVTPPVTVTTMEIHIDDVYVE